MNRDEHAEQRFRAIVAGAGDRDTKLWAILELLEDTLALPTAAHLGDDRVTLTHVDYGGDPDQGLIAAIATDDGLRSVPLTDVALLSREPGASLVASYGGWLAGRATTAQPSTTATSALPSEGSLELAVLAVQPRTARCRRLDDGEAVVLRPSARAHLVPGTLITLRARTTTGLIEGDIVDVTIDASRLGVVPPALLPLDDPTAFALAVPEAPAALEEAELLAAGGDPQGARKLLLELLADDLLILDAHAALGVLELDHAPQVALAHCAVGAALGDLAIPDQFKGRIPATAPGNRGYLACLHGCGRALHRLGRDAEARVPLRRLLALDPDDAFGAAQLLVAVGGAE